MSRLSGSRFLDLLAPKGDTVQVILKRKGKPVAGIYKDDKQEIRSLSLQDKADDDDRNP